LKPLMIDFEKQSGQTLIPVWGPSMGQTAGAIPKRLERGEAIDVVIMVGDALDKLVDSGQVDTQAHSLLALSKIGVAVRAGANAPDISTEGKLKAALLEADSIAYSDSASGEYLSKVLFPRLGVAAQIRDKAHMIPAEPVGQVVARGEVTLGFQQVSELLPVAGIRYVGEIPEEDQQVTPYAAGLVRVSKVPALAKAFLEYLKSPQAAQLIQKTGLTPVASQP
jgi:molybdate transport system substrate-binding protein